MYHVVSTSRAGSRRIENAKALRERNAEMGERMAEKPTENMAGFRASLAQAQPPEGWSAPLAALWHLEKGNWQAAHALVQDDESRAGAWVHAHIHRIEGDHGNARYWYGRAGQPAGEGDLNEERAGIMFALMPS
jgi:hypothetical protein